MASCPNNVNIVMCKWVFPFKYNANDGVARHKAQLVAHGFTQDYNTNNTRTLFLVVHLNSIHVPLSLIINHGLTIQKLDIFCPFPLVDLNEKY